MFSRGTASSRIPATRDPGPPERVLLTRLARAKLLIGGILMPVYEYRCLDCEKEFEVVETLAEHGDHGPLEVKCPHCGKQYVERAWSHVVAVTSKKS